MRTSRRPLLALASMALALLSACDTTSTTVPDEPDGGSAAVIELAVRRLNDGQDVAEFEAARDAFVARLREQDGVEVDREFQAFFDFGTQAAPTAPVFVGMTQYATSEAFGAAGEALG